MCGGRFASTLIYMAYPACLPRLMTAWEMTAGALVGLIIGTFGSALIWGWPW
jgi:hypothetical protein